MAVRTARVASASGLHARPASVFTSEVAKAGVPVHIATENGAPVDALSILMVMSLGVQHGDVVRLSTEGDGSEQVLDRLVELLESDLDAATAPSV